MTKNRSIVKKQLDNPTCPQCGKKWHVESKRWRFHVELLPKMFEDKGKQNIVVTIYLGSDSGDVKDKDHCNGK